MVGINGPEGNNILGSFVEGEVEAFFSNFLKWKLLYRKFDETFLNVDSKEEEKRGFDFLYQLCEPFNDEYVNHGVIVESKKIKDHALFSKNRLTTDIDTLKSKIEKARNSKNLHDDEKIRENEIHYFKYGILCYRFLNFDKDKYLKVLKEYQFRDKRRGANFPTIFVLSNERLSAFMHLKSKKQSLKYFYPSYRDNKWMGHKDQLSLFYLFSDIIPFESDGKKYVLSFDEPTPKSFKFIKDFCSRFNYEISGIVLANSDFTQKHIYEQYMMNLEKEVGHKLELLCLNNDMNCAEELTEVFKNER